MSYSEHKYLGPERDRRAFLGVAGKKVRQRQVVWRDSNSNGGVTWMGRSEWGNPRYSRPVKEFSLPEPAHVVKFESDPGADRRKRAITAGLSTVGAAAGLAGLAYAGRDVAAARGLIKPAKDVGGKIPLRTKVLLPLEGVGLGGEVASTKILGGDARRQKQPDVQKSWVRDHSKTAGSLLAVPAAAGIGTGVAVHRGLRRKNVGKALADEGVRSARHAAGLKLRAAKEASAVRRRVPLTLRNTPSMTTRDPATFGSGAPRGPGFLRPEQREVLGFRKAMEGLGMDALGVAQANSRGRRIVEKGLVSTASQAGKRIVSEGRGFKVGFKQGFGQSRTAQDFTRSRDAARAARVGGASFTGAVRSGMASKSLSQVGKARRFDPEADRQRRLGAYSGVAAGGALLAGEATRRNTQLIMRKPVGSVKTMRGGMGRGARAFVLTGNAKGAVAAGTTAGLAALSGIAYRRGVSERNKTWT